MKTARFHPQDIAEIESGKAEIKRGEWVEIKRKLNL